jgi:hypothetical protein
MPDYRKLYNSAGHSEKVSRLTDFEFRVWIQMRASADDFGVGPMIPGKLQGDNRSLARQSPKAVSKEMEEVVAIGLVELFDHQGQSYYFQPDWQDRETVTYPKRSVYPYPPATRISVRTSELIQLAEESLAKKREKKFQKHSPENSQTILKESGDYARVDTRGNPQPITDNPSEDRRDVPQIVTPQPVPLVQSPLKWKHGEHELGFCDWMCLPADLVNQWANRLAVSNRTSVSVERPRVVAWAKSVMASGIVPKGKMYDFWNERWNDSPLSSTPSDGSVTRELAEAEARRRSVR